MDEMNVDLRTARRRFSLVGFAFSALIAVALLAQVGLHSRLVCCFLKWVSRPAPFPAAA